MSKFTHPIIYVYIIINLPKIQEGYHFYFLNFFSNFFRSKKTRGSKVTRLAKKNRQRKRLKIKLFSLLIFQILKFTTKHKKYGKTIEKSIFFRYNNSNQKIKKEGFTICI